MVKIVTSELVVRSNGGELHLRSDDSLARIPELGNRMTCRSTERLTLAPFESGELDQAFPLGGAGELGVLAREVAVVHRLDLAALLGGGIATFPDPGGAQGRETLPEIAFKVRINPRGAAVIDAYGIIGLQFSGEVLGRRELDLAHPDTHLGMAGSLHIDP